jgi:hypothetical protein
MRPSWLEVALSLTCVGHMSCWLSYNDQDNFATSAKSCFVSMHALRTTYRRASEETKIRR